jgi:hypothetical protein
MMDTQNTQEMHKNSINVQKNEPALTATATGAIKQDGTPAGAGYAGRMGTGTTRGIQKAGDRKKPAAEQTLARVTEVIIHETGEGDPVPENRKYLRSSGIVHTAMGKLEDWNFRPSKIVSSSTPVDIIAFRNEKTLLVQVIYSRGPVPDAKTLGRVYAKEMGNLRAMGTNLQFRKVVMVYSAQCGWKCYDVLPGGLIPAWNLPEEEEE